MYNIRGCVWWSHTKGKRSPLKAIFEHIGPSSCRLDPRRQVNEENFRLLAAGMAKLSKHRKRQNTASFPQGLAQTVDTICLFVCHFYSYFTRGTQLQGTLGNEYKQT